MRLRHPSFWLRASLIVGTCLAWVYVAPSRAATLEAIQRDGNLKVCIWPDYYAISLRNPRSGQLEGIDIDMSRALAADLGVAVTHVDSSFATLIDDVLGKKCDVAMFGIATTPERSARLVFTKPHLRSGILAIATRNHPSVKSWDDIDRSGRIVAVQAGTYMESAMRDVLNYAEILSVQRPRTREQEVQSGRADVFMTDYPYARRLIETADWARLVEPPAPVHPIGYAYAAAPGDPVWLARLDDFVARIKRDGRLKASAERHKLLPIVVLD